jgi:hypothetical protein
LIGVALFLALIGLAYVLPMHVDRLRDEVAAIEESQKGAHIEMGDGLVRIPVCENGRWGYVDERGQLVIQMQFRSAGEFADGRAAVRGAGLFGYINAMGDWVIEPMWDVATPFSEGLAVVYSDHRASVIDTNGRVIFSCDQAYIEPFEGGLAHVEADAGSGLVTSTGRFLAVPGHDYAIMDDARVFVCDSPSESMDRRSSRSWRLIDREGRTIRSYENVTNVKAVMGVPLAVLFQRTSSGYAYALVVDRSGVTRDVLSHEEAMKFNGVILRSGLPEFVGRGRRSTLDRLSTVLDDWPKPRHGGHPFRGTRGTMMGEDVVLDADSMIVVENPWFSSATRLRFLANSNSSARQIDTMWVDSVVSVHKGHVVVTLHDTMCVVAADGSIVWRGRDRARSEHERDIAYQGDSFGARVSRGDEDLQPKSIDRSTMSKLSAATRADGLDSVHVITEYAERNGLLLVSIVNRRSDTLHLVWSSRGVQLSLEARPSSLREWTRVEEDVYLCGQDGFPLPIPPGQFIRMKGAAYQGARTYEARMAFLVLENGDGWRREATWCYSPIFLSRLNPAQFYSPSFR